MPIPKQLAGDYQVTELLDGQIKLVFGDCRKFIPPLPWHSIDLVVTDPPYGISYKTNYTSHNNGYVRKTPVHDEIEGDADIGWLGDVLHSISGKTKLHGAVYWFCSPRKRAETVEMFSDFSIRNEIIWDKVNWPLGDLYTSYGSQYEIVVYAAKGSGPRLKHRIGDVFRVGRVMQQTEHPNQKPLQLIEKFVSNSSNEGDLIFDPFMGSGQTAIACLNLNRRFVGCEIDPKYFALSKRRIEAHIIRLGLAHEKALPVSVGRAV